MSSLVKFVQDEFVPKNTFPEFGAGDTITVYYEIKEGSKTSGSIGVERIFPINLPALQKIEVNKAGKVRRARIFYFRNLTGKKARIKEVRRK